MTLLQRSLDQTHLELPGLTTVHSHAFQRMMRGSAQRPARPNTRESFWSWRGAMYEAALSLDPESLERISRVAYRELYASGVRTVGEFHYIHHQADGTPYDDRTLMSDIVVRAAKAEGLRIALLRTAYHRAGPGREPERGQLRFCDPEVDHVLADVETLRAKYKGDPDVVVGIAPHSVRAVPPAFLREYSAYAERHQLPIHMHVAEQPREIDECIDETGKRPIELLADLGVLSPRFVAVHATHTLEHETRLLGKAGAYACVCATTEADLGDGLPDLTGLRSAGTKMCAGIDSHVITDPIADVRALETLARLRTGTRATFSPEPRTPAEQLWHEGSLVGAQACGFDDVGGTVRIARAHPSLELVEEELLLDAIVFGTGAAIFG